MGYVVVESEAQLSRAIGMFHRSLRSREVRRVAKVGRVEEVGNLRKGGSMVEEREGDSLSETRWESRSYAYLRPNLLYTRKFVIVHSTFSASSEE